MKMTLNEEIELLRNGKWFDKIGGTLPNNEYLNLGWAIGDVLDTEHQKFAGQRIAVASCTRLEILRHGMDDFRNERRKPDGD